MIKTRIIPAFVATAIVVSGIALPGAALAAEEQIIEDVSFSYEGPFGTYDRLQLQRGFQVYQEVCSACHGLQYLSFRELRGATGPAFPEEQVKAIAALYDVYDPEIDDTRPGKPFDMFPANTDAGAPDLSLMAKARAGFHGPYGLGLSQLINGIGGAEYIYSMLTGYTGEEIEEAGAILYENHAFPGGKISMPPPLEEDLVEYVMHGGEDGDAGEAPEATVEQMAEDVSAFLMWAAEPQLVERKQAGFRNILMLITLTVLLYFTNKALWAGIKRKE
jgi:ubiquinol-cytochrome c reductase cytochrome c1 subunit